LLFIFSVSEQESEIAGLNAQKGFRYIAEDYKSEGVVARALNTRVELELK
jgi:hypothetical protein